MKTIEFVEEVNVSERIKEFDDEYNIVIKDIPTDFLKVATEKIVQTLKDTNIPEYVNISAKIFQAIKDAGTGQTSSPTPSSWSVHVVEAYPRQSVSDCIKEARESLENALRLGEDPKEASQECVDQIETVISVMNMITAAIVRTQHSPLSQRFLKINSI